jgi:integrase
MCKSLNNVDWDLLHQQKLTLLEMLNRRRNDTPEAEALSGIINLLETVEDDEALHLTWADVDFDRDTIQVSPKTEGMTTFAWTPKDFETRQVPVPGETTALLAKLQNSAPEGHAYVFLPADRFLLIKEARTRGLWREQQTVLNNFQRSFRRLVLRAAQKAPTLKDEEGNPTISMHDLRRSAITNWSRKANMQTVMRMAGHSNIETTRRYYAATTEDQIALVREASAAAIRGAGLKQTDPKLTPKAKNRSRAGSKKSPHPSQSSLK